MGQIVTKTCVHCSARYQAPEDEHSTCPLGHGGRPESSGGAWQALVLDHRALGLVEFQRGVRAHVGDLHVSPDRVSYVSQDAEAGARALCSMIRACHHSVLTSVVRLDPVGGNPWGLALLADGARVALAFSDGSWDVGDGVSADEPAQAFLEALAQRLKIEPADALDTLPPF